MRPGQCRHAHDGVHRRPDIVAHGGKEITLCLAGLPGNGKRLLKCVLAPPLLRQHIRHIRPYKAHGPVVLIPPKHIDLLIPDSVIPAVRKDKIISSWFLCQCLEDMFQTEPAGRSIPVLRIILPHEPFGRAIIIIRNIRRKILQNGLARMHGHAPGIYIDDSYQVKGICHYIKEPLLFPHRIRYVRAHQADPSQAEVHL